MYADYSSSINVEEKRNEGKNMIKKEKIVITIALVVSCITATPVAVQILLERYAYSEISGTSILI